MQIPARRIMKPFLETDESSANDCDSDLDCSGHCGTSVKRGITIGKQNNGIICADTLFPDISHGIETETRVIEARRRPDRIITLRAKTSHSTEGVLLSLREKPDTPSNRAYLYHYDNSDSDSRWKHMTRAIQLPTLANYCSEAFSRPSGAVRALREIFSKMIDELLKMHKGRFTLIPIIEDETPDSAVRDLCESYRDMAIEASRALYRKRDTQDFLKMEIAA